MKKLRTLLAAGGIAALVAIPVAWAAGFLTSNYPPAGGTQFPFTIPLTGFELFPADTQLASGQPPQSESISTAQLATFLTVPQVSTATNTTSFTATAAQVAPAVAGARQVAVLLTGALAAGATLTTPTAAQIAAAIPVPSVVGGTVIGETWLLRFSNESTGAFAWTIAGGTGVTITGSATVPQNGARTYLATLVSATSVTLVDQGN